MKTKLLLYRLTKRFFRTFWLKLVLFCLIFPVYFSFTVSAQDANLSVDTSGIFDTPINSDVIVYCQFKPVQCETCTDSVLDGNLSLAFEAVDQWGDPSAQVRFTTGNGYIDARNGTSWPVFDPSLQIPVVFDSVYHCWIEIFFIDQLYNVYIQALGATEPLLIAENFGFRNTAVTELTWWGSVRNNTVTQNILNVLEIKFTDVIGLEEEPVDAITETAYKSFGSRVFPNPVTDVSVLNYILEEASAVEITFYDINGKAIKTIFESNPSPGLNHLTINKSGFNTGVYYYRISAGKYSGNGKLIVR